MSVIVHIKFLEGSVPMVGFGTVTDIEPQSDRWRGWSFEVDEERGRLLMMAPKGWPEQPSEAMRAEMAALGSKSQGRFIIREPLHRCRIVMLDAAGVAKGGERDAYGPSYELRDTWQADADRRAEEAAERERRNAEVMAAAQASGKKSKPAAPAKPEPKRPAWAKKDPTPPPSPPEEDAPSA